MSEPVAVPHVAALAVDTPCVGCGYNLRGLSADGRCPECNAPIARSAQGATGNLLKYADPGWLGKLRQATSLMLWSIVIGLFLGLGIGVLTSLRTPRVLVSLLSTVGAFLGLWSTFLLTTQEPRVALTEDPVSLRKLVRICAVAIVVGQVLTSFAEFMRPWTTAVFITGGVLSLAGIVSYFGQFVYFRRFAERIPEPSLARSTTTVMWGIVASYSLLGVMALVAFAGGLATTGGIAGPGTQRTPQTGLLVGVGSIACAGGVGALVFGIWYIRLLTRYNTAFKQAVQEASLPQPALGTPRETPASR